MQTAIIPASWMAITGTLSAKSMVALRREVDAQHVDPTNHEAVTTIWNELNAQARKQHAALKAEKKNLTERLNTIRTQIETLEDVYPRTKSTKA
jgi:hypothetical protein